MTFCCTLRTEPSEIWGSSKNNPFSKGHKLWGNSCEHVQLSIYGSAPISLRDYSRGWAGRTVGVDPSENIHPPRIVFPTTHCCSTFWTENPFCKQLHHWILEGKYRQYKSQCKHTECPPPTAAGPQADWLLVEPGVMRHTGRPGCLW